MVSTRVERAQHETWQSGLRLVAPVDPPESLGAERSGEDVAAKHVARVPAIPENPGKINAGKAVQRRDERVDLGMDQAVRIA